MTKMPTGLLALLFLCHFGVSAEAAPITLTLDAPLFDSSGAHTTLTGSLLYDADLMSGSGSFQIDGYSNSFSGFALALDTAPEEPPADIAFWTSIGIVFSGTADDGSSLYFNIDTAPTSMLSDNVTLSIGGSNTSFYSSAAPSSVGTPSEPPFVDPDSDPTGVSAVPLPPAISLYGSALAMLGLAGFGRRVLARQRGAARRGIGTRSRYSVEV
ncbi:hypothetical protein [Lichenifustis flavocetrariae]|uniref:PEP-CTERM sorting domain-containing protein n=1 Tax=Lichenifustis flavocetrariae TaxID=2949735 RepID=A0AA42CPJ0_9HYPH|nr:hypothetical protein [Lichenifustis flavocetrariae]MCW6510430.1 hypothetical protein [Lichenifustis flavocetrariae]